MPIVMSHISMYNRRMVVPAWPPPDVHKRIACMHPCSTGTNLGRAAACFYYKHIHPLSRNPLLKICGHKLNGLLKRGFNLWTVIRTPIRPDTQSTPPSFRKVGFWRVYWPTISWGCLVFRRYHWHLRIPVGEFRTARKCHHVPRGCRRLISVSRGVPVPITPFNLQYIWLLKTSSSYRQFDIRVHIGTRYNATPDDFYARLFLINNSDTFWRNKSSTLPIGYHYFTLGGHNIHSKNGKDVQ